ncbi:MAG: tryptophan synthase subunit beta [Candidatus Shapirobacteria bacterium]
MNTKNKYNLPTNDGFFGDYGGRYVPSSLEPILKELFESFNILIKDPKFLLELNNLYRQYANRPSSLYFASSLTKYCGGAKIYFKREDLNHTGAHKINNALGQALLAKKMKKNKLIAETGAGQHGVATATVAALFGMKCDIYMGARDIVNQRNNVYRMKLLGANVIEVQSGQKTLKDAVDAALLAYINEPDSYYLLGSVVGPHPYPLIVREFQKIIGQEVKKQIIKKEKRLPDYLIACVGGGSNAMGIFHDFIDDSSVKLIGVEPAGLGINSNRHGLSLKKGKQGIIHGFKCLLLQDKKGNISESYSAASGLDYPGVGPELCYLKSIHRLDIKAISDKEAVFAFKNLCQIEGIIPALESAHAIAYTIKLAKSLTKDKIIVVNLSGRGDKDVENIYENLLPLFNVKI